MLKNVNKDDLIVIYERLIDVYDYHSWWPSQNSLEIILGAILTQNTNWDSVLISLEQLKPFLDARILMEIDLDFLQELIKPSGFFRQKASYIKEFLNWYKNYDYDDLNLLKLETKSFRHELLNIKGIGKETADSILLFAYKRPVFVIDAYTYRVFGRLGYDTPKKYDDFQHIFMNLLEADNAVYYNFHAVIVMLAKDKCKKIPKCEDCILKDICLKKI